jgi:hypothetical protein
MAVALPADVTAALRKQAPKAMRGGMEKEAKKEFERIKQEMIKEFMANPITQEILAGPDSGNISGTLGGVSNLFAFIGFDGGEDPIAPILALFEKMTIKFDREITRPKIGNRFRVDLPTADEIFAITPLPWASGRSWAQGIERGLSGLGYLLRKNKGRSGAAIQSRVKVRTGRFQNTPYISALISKYKKKFEELR